MSSRKKRTGRTFRLRLQSGQNDQRQAGESSESMALVLAELTPGKTSVGFRLGSQETVHFFAEDLTPQEAAQMVADIMQGRISADEISTRPDRVVHYPIEQEKPLEAVTYKYVLPRDDQEVMVSAAAMALLDLVKQPLIGGREHVEARAHYHCEQAHLHSRELLTNDYEGWKRLFIPNYVVIYQHAADRIDLDKMRAIADRHDLLTVLSEFRNIVKMTFFPDLADLSRLTMEREGIRLTPHRAASGYYVSFDYQGEIRRTPVKETPRDAFKEAERLIEGLNDDEDLQGQQ